MAPRYLPFLVASLLLACLLAGCTGNNPAASVTPAPTTPEMPATVQATAIPTPEPFPGALSLGTPFQYGREDISTEVTITGVRTMAGYDWWSPQWGRYWNTSPKKGDQFLFAFLRIVDRGTARARLPSQGMFVLRGADGSAFTENVDRDPGLLIKGIDVKQYDFSFDNTAGWLDPGYSNRVEGFLLYEVPANLTPADAYLEATLSSKASAVWKLG